jgi:hypothetical protein
VDAINAANLDRFPSFKQVLINAGFHTVVVPLQDDLVRDVKGTLYLLWGGTLFVLLIGCVNVVNLALVRARVRAREIAMRLALGAGRWRLARQLVTESVVLTVLSGLLGLLLGWAALRVLGSVSLDQVPRGGEIRLDGVSVAFTMGVAAVLGVDRSVPSLPAPPVDMVSVFHEGGRTRSGGRGERASPGAGRSAGGRGVRAAARRGAADGQLPARLVDRSGLRPPPGPDRQRHATRLPLCGRRPVRHSRPRR